MLENPRYLWKTYFCYRCDDNKRYRGHLPHRRQCQWGNFSEICLLNIIQPFDGNNACSVVLDNASIHRIDTVVELITAAGALIQFLPPYSLDLNPIEDVFSKIKAFLKENKSAYQATSEPRRLVAHAFASVSCEDCIKYIRHAGYTE